MNLLSFCATEREETMVSAGDFRNGLTIEIDGTVYQGHLEQNFREHIVWLKAL